MKRNGAIESIIGKSVNGKKSLMPARFDLWQSITGVILAMFMIFHMFFTSTILAGADAFDWVVKQIEFSFLFGEPVPIITLFVVIFISVVFAFHAFLAMRKFPATYSQLFTFWQHRKMLKHSDTSLWLIQYLSGFLLFFLCGAHLLMILVSYDSINSVTASTRFSEMGVFYIILLLVTLSHVSIGVYRLAVKWVSFGTKSDRRVAMVKIKKSVFSFFIVLGFVAFLADLAYIKHGNEIAQNKSYIVEQTNK